MNSLSNQCSNEDGVVRMTAVQRAQLAALQKQIEQIFADDKTGHDLPHLHRVCRNAQTIMEREGKGDEFIVQASALLHDVNDRKRLAAGHARVDLVQYCRAVEIDLDEALKINYVASNISFKGVAKQPVPEVFELAIVEDADRLDSLGAIGIARALIYGASCDRPLHEPGVEPVLCYDIESYRAQQSSTINSLRERTLHIHRLMHTATGRELAQPLHNQVEKFVSAFLNQWDGLYF